MESTIRVLIADDHTIVREGLRAVLGSEPDMEVVGEAATGREVVELATEVRPDAILMDIQMPQTNGMLQSGGWRTKVVLPFGACSMKGLHRVNIPLRA